MIHCIKCQVDVNPVHELQASGRVTPCCPECGSGLAEPDAVPVAVPTMARTEQQRGTPLLPLAETPAEGDVLSLAKRRLAAINIEIAALRRLEVEQSMLERMIAAAEPSEDRAQA